MNKDGFKDMMLKHRELNDRIDVDSDIEEYVLKSIVILKGWIDFGEPIRNVIIKKGEKIIEKYFKK